MSTKPKKDAEELPGWSGVRLRRIREERGLTQSELARALEIDVMLVSRYERGVHAPRAGIVFALCEALGCDANELFGFK